MYICVCVLAWRGQAIELSGIVTILFTGMFSRHYTHGNLSVEGQVRQQQQLAGANTLDADTACIMSTPIRHAQPRPEPVDPPGGALPALTWALTCPPPHLPACLPAL